MYGYDRQGCVPAVLQGGDHDAFRHLQITQVNAVIQLQIDQIDFDILRQILG